MRLGRSGLSLIVMAIGLCPAGNAQEAADPPPSSPAASREAALEERLRKMEEMNQGLLRQFATIAKQNEQLAGQVRELSKKVESQAGLKRVAQSSVVDGGDGIPADVTSDPSAPTISDDAGRPSRSPGGGATGPGGGGGETAAPGGVDVTAPTISDD